MLKFNNDNIFTGYLKQLLASFNLPNYRVYTEEQRQYHEWAIKQNNPNIPLEKDILETIATEKMPYPVNLRYTFYIKDGLIQKYCEGKWYPTKLHYHWNKKELNNTKTLKIKNNVYDSYTHEYLGNFLRFIRDYNNIDLMPLYNCFSNNLCPNLHITFTNPTNSAEKINFNTDDTNYKIYMIPVKLFQTYTLAIDSETPIEMCCGFFGAYQDTREKVEPIYQFTYKKLNSTKFNSPVILDMLSGEKLNQDQADADMIDTLELAQNEADLKLFLKLPALNKSSITLLEGNFNGYNNIKLSAIPTQDPLQQRWLFNSNHTITNYEKSDNIPNVDDRMFRPITNLQLLAFNTGISYPFADRLIEYLAGNTITSEETIADNIKRVQTVLASRYMDIPVYGAWNNGIRNIIYDYINTKSNMIPGINHDILGYVDKDAEKYYVTPPNKDAKSTSISNICIYHNIYNNN